jgi:hypothetical protein
MQIAVGSIVDTPQRQRGMIVGRTNHGEAVVKLDNGVKVAWPDFVLVLVYGLRYPHRV